MSNEIAEYIHLPAGAELPSTSNKPRRVLVLVEQDVDTEWQDAVSRWIVDSGCLFMMALGRKCSTWDDSVDHAKFEKYGYGELSDDKFVMTTWHENEPLSGAFFFARMCAFHPTVAMPLLTIVDIRHEARRSAILALHEAEGAGLLEDIPDDPRDLPFKERLKILMRK